MQRLAQILRLGSKRRNLRAFILELHSSEADIVSIFGKGLEAHNAGDLTVAEQIYKETLTIQPDHCEANHNIGIVLVAKNELDKALEFFKLALTASPNVSLFWASYIDTLAKLERIIEAKALIKAARNSGMACENIEAISHRLDTENQEPLAKDTRKIDEFITQKKFDDAIEACLNLLETYPTSAILNITLGKCYFELGRIDLAISSYTKATEYWPQSEVSYAMLGQIYSSQGDTEHAIKNLSKAVELKPDDHELQSLLGIELTQNGDFDEAIRVFEQALKFDPHNVISQHHLAALTGQTTASAPNKYIEQLFDGYALKFEHSLVDTLEYKTPNLIAEVVLKLKSGAELGPVLDLGCGTGLAGVALSGLCQNIEGIDLSKKMLSQANQKNVYDKLSHTGIVEYLSEAALDFDLFIAADVFVYVGELSEVFRLIKSRNKRHGRLAFSTEHTEKADFFLEASGRYSHSKSYIDSLCNKFNYKLLHFSNIDLRKSGTEFITGGLYLLEF